MNTNEDNLLLMAFSDWRVQKIDDIISFLNSLERLPDFILYGGDDIGRFWNEETNYFSEISKYSNNKKVLAVIGNDDTLEIKKILQGDNILDLHDSPYVYKDYCFLGLEGSTSTPGIIVYSEEYVRNHLNQQILEANNRKKIIISHPPPYGILDKGIRFAQKDKGFNNIGSKSLLEFIKTNDIQLVICGHCHSHGGIKQKYENTLIINVASHDNSGAEGRFALIEISSEGNIDVKWYTTTNLISNNSLLNIYGIGSQKNVQLQEAGINNIQDLLYCDDLEKVSSLSGLSKTFLNKTKLRAKSLKEGVIYQIGTIFLPKNPIFLDIETDLSCKKVWLIGILLNGKYTSLFANTWDEEHEILSQLIQILKDNPEHCLISYSGTHFDKNVLFGALDKYFIDSNFFMLYPHYDLCQMIRSSFIFPNGNFKLKNLGAFLGYGFKHQDLNGLMVALAYHDHIETKRPLDKKYIEYNEDDVRSTEYIFNLIKDEGIELKKEIINEDNMITIDLSDYSEDDLFKLIKNIYEERGKIYTKFDRRYGGWSLELKFYAKKINELDLIRNAMSKMGFVEGSIYHYKGSNRIYVPYYGKNQSIRFIETFDPKLYDKVKEKITMFTHQVVEN